MRFVDSLLDGRRCDLRVDSGRIDALRWLDCGPGLDPVPGEEVRTGGCITPPLAEPHCHLDAALLGADAPNVSGTLVEGIENWSRLRPDLTVQDVQDRALRTAEMYAEHGCLRIRTHVDTGSLTAVGALLELKPQLAARGIELQVVAFPQEGILRAPGRRDQWERAVRMGCDAVGAIPHFERTTQEGWDTVRMAFELADALGLHVDLHCDETDDPGSRNLEVVCAQALDRGMGQRVIAGHCTALHSYPNPYAAKIIELVRLSGVQVVANPLDNVVLQGRYDGYPKRRGMTRVDELWAAGAHVGIGHDSVQDPWYALGTANMLDPAWMLVHLGHLTGVDQVKRAFRTLHHDNHRAWGGPDPIVEGGPARLLWWPAADGWEVLRDRPKPLVLRGLYQPASPGRTGR